MIRRIIKNIKELLCVHIWSDDMTRPEAWRLKSGWLSLGGFPEIEYRNCTKCNKHEEK